MVRVTLTRETVKQLKDELQKAYEPAILILNKT